ncbi:MAG TPA: [protein-PII] uridylyltransferase [Terriglobia bacterium]|nr:[protein-PII] uridylyltransferase [Terriglobia bacterium]
MPPLPLNTSLLEFCSEEFHRIRAEFESSGNGHSDVLARSQVVDRVNQGLYQSLIAARSEPPEELCVAALGGYGRQELFPQSDIDLLFVSRRSATLSQHRELIGQFVRSLWDLRLRASQTCRTLDDCSMLHRDNLEFNVAMVDLRYVAGSKEIFSELHEARLLELFRKDGITLLTDLIEMTRQRHHKHSDTIFHLEPNIKEVPGGFRDFHVIRWLSLIAGLESGGQWKAAEDLFPARSGETAGRAFRFLAATRCFLHYRKERDDNRLSYELQEEAAGQGIGVGFGRGVPPADWMRAYFRHARTVKRLAGETMDEVQPGRLALYDIYRDWKSRVSNLDFSAVRGRIFLKLPAEARDFSYLMRLFEFVARHGLEMGRETEQWVEQSLPGGLGGVQNYPDFWKQFCGILSLPHAIDAVRAMHRLGWLEEFFPEFRAIDALVIRDFYHRYTVDEHSLLTLQNVCALRNPENEWEQKFGEILSELEEPHLLLFSLLFHDVGKGMAAENHIEGSLQAAEQVFARLRVKKEDRQTVRFLIRRHLEMSVSFQHRDIFDPATVHRLMEVAGSHNRLKMLTLLTYADIKSVNPEALTPWKAEMLWTLYAATSNALARSLDSDRIQSAGETVAPENGAAALEDILQLPQDAGKFLEGLPRRYLRIHAVEEIEIHHQMAKGLSHDPVLTLLKNRDHYWELTVVARDKPRLFASLTGVLTAWGLNIVAAEAFANSSGTVLDTFRFVDLFHTLDLNPPEQERLQQTIRDVLTDRKNLEELMRGRIRTEKSFAAGARIATRIRFDDTSSSHSTLLELTTQDRQGLLYQISSLLSEHRCNIEVAAIDTQGRKAIDVFYLTIDGNKLNSEHKQVVEDALLTAL